MSKPNQFGSVDDAPTIAGVVAAKVTDNEDPEGLGRVKVTYPFRDTDDESYWARVATEMASEDYGTFFLPEVGDEVLVAFEDGDIRYPFVIGSLYNGQRKPPEDNSSGDNNYRTVVSRAGHKLEFEDSDDAPKITIETDGGRKITLNDESGSEKIEIDDGSNTVTLDKANGEVSVEAQQTLSLSAPTIELEADSEVSISSNAKVNMDGNAQVNVSSKGQLNVESNGMMGIKATGPLQVQGAIIQLN